MVEIKRLPHPLHEQHLCFLENIGTNFEDIKKLAHLPQL
jgi:hypothetical protein